jgi:murein DD-endopeptidase MepM/ murein hydrolase activator NlpD
VASKRFSIIIVPPENGKVVNREISQRLLVICSLFLSCFIVASVYSAIGFIKSNVDRQKLTGLTKENQVLSAKIGDMESTVSMLRSEMSKIINKDENIRLVFDLPPIDADIREVGVGGENQEPIIKSELGERTWLVQEDIEKIGRQLNLENASYEELLTLVQDRKVRLDHMPTITPCEGYVSRGFGMHNDPFTGSYQPHNGIDIATPRGTPVCATAEGIVASASFTAGLGNLIQIDHGDGISTCYGHLSKIMVAPGHKVQRGEIIGLVGSTGYSTGPHLHYEVHTNGRAVDPSNYIVKSILSLL